MLRKDHSHKSMPPRDVQDSFFNYRYPISFLQKFNPFLALFAQRILYWYCLCGITATESFFPILKLMAYCSLVSGNEIYLLCWHQDLLENMKIRSWILSGMLTWIPQISKSTIPSQWRWNLALSGAPVHRLKHASEGTHVCLGHPPDEGALALHTHVLPILHYGCSIAA